MELLFVNCSIICFYEILGYLHNTDRETLNFFWDENLSLVLLDQIKNDNIFAHTFSLMHILGN